MVCVCACVCVHGARSRLRLNTCEIPPGSRSHNPEPLPIVLGALDTHVTPGSLSTDEHLNPGSLSESCHSCHAAKWTSRVQSASDTWLAAAFLFDFNDHTNRDVR